jgi:hypothetical protein
MLSVTTPAETIPLRKIDIRVLIDSPTTGASLTLFEMDVPRHRTLEGTARKRKEAATAASLANLLTR